MKMLVTSIFSFSHYCFLSHKKNYIRIFPAMFSKSFFPIVFNDMGCAVKDLKPFLAPLAIGQWAYVMVRRASVDASVHPSFRLSVR